MVQKKSLISSASVSKKPTKTDTPAALSAGASLSGSKVTSKVAAKRVAKVVAAKRLAKIVASKRIV